MFSPVRGKNFKIIIQKIIKHNNNVICCGFSRFHNKKNITNKTLAILLYVVLCGAV